MEWFSRGAAESHFLKNCIHLGVSSYQSYLRFQCLDIIESIQMHPSFLWPCGGFWRLRSSTDVRLYLLKVSPCPSNMPYNLFVSLISEMLSFSKEIRLNRINYSFFQLFITSITSTDRFLICRRLDFVVGENISVGLYFGSDVTKSSYSNHWRSSHIKHTSYTRLNSVH